MKIDQIDLRSHIMLILTTISVLVLSSCAAVPDEKLAVNMKANGFSRDVSSKIIINGVCEWNIRRGKSEAPSSYGLRGHEAASKYNNLLDMDCIFNNDSKQELIRYAKKNDYTAIYYLNYVLISENASSYCNGNLILYGNENIEYKNKVNYRDYLVEYYLFLVRVKRGVCGDFRGAGPYFRAAIDLSADVRPLY